MYNVHLIMKRIENHAIQNFPLYIFIPKCFSLLQSGNLKMTVKPMLYLYQVIIVTISDAVLTQSAHNQAKPLYRRQAESGNEVLQKSEELVGLKSRIKQQFPAQQGSVSINKVFNVF